jgi:2-oxoglutarate ferredoxin oxidoreductase subunit gamma
MSKRSWKRRGRKLTEKKRSKKNGAGKTRIERINIRIAGSGGQGVISTGMLLGRAIAIGDRKNVSQSQAYGAEARGGFAQSDIIVSDGEIYFPSCDLLDILVAFNYSAYEQNAPRVKQEGLIIADERAVDVLVGTAKTVKVPFISTSLKKFNREIIANMISLGFLSSYLSLVSESSIIDSIKEEYGGSKHLDLNIKGIRAGISLGTELLKTGESE